MAQPMSDRGAAPSSVLRFDLAIQRNHLLVYTLALITGLLAMALGAVELRVGTALLLWAVACTSAVVLYLLYSRGIERRILNPLWITIDIVLVTVGVYASGGATSPVFVWYIATASAAAFASGRKAAWAASAGNAIAYIGLLLFIGQARPFDDVMLLAVVRMLFVFGASYYFLVGVANLQAKRIEVRHLEAERSRKIEELTRLTQELAAANEAIKEADRLKSQFLANMSHELRTPMNSIIGFSEILIERLEPQIDARHLGFLRHIHHSGKHLLEIINDILDLSKIEAGKMEVYPEFFAIAPVVEEVCHMVRGGARGTPEILVDIPQDLPQIEADPGKFKQVLFNLLSNAVKFSPMDQPVRVSAALDGGTITVSVRDEGIGIDPRHHEMIFQEFRQVDGTPRREFGGTGLGLALVRKFLELQGGSVSVESSLGAGSTFSFTLPVRSRAAVVARTTASASEAESNGGRILVVEDDANAFLLISAALGSAGFLPIRAHHGEEAIRIARESRPDAITLDLVLPGIDGWDVLRRLKNDEVTRDLPVVIVSMVESRDLGMALGAADYFVKPVDRDRLVERLRLITGQGGTAAARRLLVIDDDPAVHLLLERDLAPLGFALERALSGEDGIRIAGRSAPDVILLDLMMPGMSGFEVADLLKAHPSTADIPIVVLTSKDVTREDRDLLRDHVTSFVRKGTSARDQLVRELRRVTGGSAER